LAASTGGLAATRKKESLCPAGRSSNFTRIWSADNSLTTRATSSSERPLELVSDGRRSCATSNPSACSARSRKAWRSASASANLL
jgi:hypothetical protein